MTSTTTASSSSPLPAHRKGEGCQGVSPYPSVASPLPWRRNTEPLRSHRGANASEEKRTNETGGYCWITSATIWGVKSASRPPTSWDMRTDPFVLRKPMTKNCPPSDTGFHDADPGARADSNTVRLPGQMSESVVLWDAVAIAIKRTARGRIRIGLSLHLGLRSAN